MLNIATADLELVKEILQTYVPESTVWAFGSRVTGKARPFSDLDLAIIADNSIDANIFSQLQEAFSESDLSFKIDVLDWHGISDEFRNIIQKQYIPIDLA